MRGGGPPSLIHVGEKDEPARLQKNPKEGPKPGDGSGNFERARRPAQAQIQGRREEYPEEGQRSREMLSPGAGETATGKRQTPHREQSFKADRSPGRNGASPSQDGDAAAPTRIPPDMATAARSNIRVDGRVESADQGRKDAVKGREQRRSRKDRKRLRLGVANTLKTTTL